MLTRDFAAEETDEGFNVTYSDDPEPIFVAKYRLDPEVAQMIRSRVVPNDAPGHFAGVLANAMPGPSGYTDEEQAAIDAAANYAADSAEGVGGPLMVQQNPPMEARQVPEALPIQAPIVAPPLVPSFGGALQTGLAAVDAVPQAPVGLAPMDMSAPQPATIQPREFAPSAPRTLAPETVKGAMLGTPATQEMPAGAPGVTPAGSSQRSGVRIGASSRRPGDASDVEFKPTELAADPAEEARLADAALLAGLKGDVAQQEAADLAAIAAETATEQARMKADYEAMVLKHNTDADRMFQDIVAGKVNPDRVYANMGTGQRIGTIIGLVLGGMGKAAAGGDNPVLTALNREIDRDIGLQREALDRKESAYRMFREQGKDDVEAWKLSKAAALDVAAAKMDAASKRYGGEEARLSAQQAVLKLRSDAAALRTQALGADYAKQLETFKTVQEAKSKAAQAKAQADGVRIDAFNANTNRMRAEREGMGAGGPGREYVVPVAPFAVQGKQGVRFTAFNKDQANKVRAAGSNAEDLLAMLEDAKEFRRDRWSAWIPTWAGGDDAALADAFRARILGAINEQRDYGALDRGSQEVIGFEAIDPGSILKSDKTIFGVLDGVAKATQRGYMNMLRSQTEEGAAAIADSLRPAGGRRAGQ